MESKLYMEINSIERVNTLKKSILNTFSFLERDYLYSPEISETSSNVFDESLDIEYVNKAKRRTVTVSYTRKVDEEVKHTFSVSIVRSPYTNVEDFFSLSNYLNSIGKDFDTKMLDDFNIVSAEVILEKIAGALKYYCDQIIEGELWLENYYPRKD
jgi:hypothetical protein